MKKILTLFILGIFCLSFVSAYNPFKWQLCTSANMSGGLCDDYWENFKEVMGINDSVTETVYYLNETRVQEMINKTFDSYMGSIDKKINDSIKGVNITQEVTKADFDNVSRTIRDNMVLNYAKKDDLDLLESKVFGKNNNDYLILILLALVGLIGGGYYLFVHKGNQQSSLPTGRPAVPKIKSRNNLEQEEKIKELENKLKEKEKPTEDKK